MGHRYIIGLVFIALCVHAPKAWACDPCNMYEYSTIQNRTFIGVFHRYRMYNGYKTLKHTPNFGAARFANGRLGHEPDNQGYFIDPSPKDFERFMTTEVRVNYTLKGRVNFQALLGWQRADVYYARMWRLPRPVRDTLTTVQGFTDPLLGAEYIHIWDPEEWPVRWILRPGLTVRVPLGQWRRKNRNGKRYDAILQPGSGSWDVVPRLNTQLMLYGKFGIDAFASVGVTTAGAQGYRRGRSINTAANVFWIFSRGQLRVVPSVGGYAEWSGRHYQSRRALANTGGYTFFMQGGIDVAIGPVALMAQYMHPLDDNLWGTQKANAGRLNVGLLYSLSR